jgi:two-component system NarL family response regulator
MDAPRRPNDRIRVLIADDQPLFAKMLVSILAGDERVEVVGQAGNGREAVELATALVPDVVVMDISMPLMDGLEATRRLREANASSRILMLTESDLPGDLRRSQQAGADGYLSKTRIASDLRQSIVNVAARSAL